MKYITVMAAAIASIGVSSAASIAFSNYADVTTTNSITDSTGKAIALGTGYVGVGYFSVTDDVLSTSNDIASISSSFKAIASGNFNLADGVYDYPVSAKDATFDGKGVYTIIGNASTLAASTEILIVKFTQNFVADPAFTDTALLSHGNAEVATVLRGDYGKFTLDPGLGSANPTYSLVQVIPETSTALLGLLGVAGLVRRRR